MSGTVWYSTGVNSRAESTVRITDANLDAYLSWASSVTLASILQADIVTPHQQEIIGVGTDTDLLQSSLKVYCRDADSNRAGLIVPYPDPALISDKGKYTGDLTALEATIKTILGSAWYLSYVGYTPT